MIAVSVVLVSLLLLDSAFPQSRAQTSSAAVLSSRNTSRQSSLRRPLVEHEIFAPFWTLEAGWSTDFEFRNNLAQEDLEVTPVLWTSDGTQFELPAVTVKPDHIERVDLRAAIDKLHFRVNAYGSAMFRYKSVSRGNLYAAIFIQLVGHPISFHVDAFAVDPSPSSGSWEGIWWLPHPTADGVVVVSNVSSQTVKAREIFSDGSSRFTEALTIGAHETWRVSIRDAIRRAGFKSSQGGIKIEPDGDAGSISVSEFLFDEHAGFSALMKVFGRNPDLQPEIQTLRAPLVGLSVPDPMLHYPEGTVLHPSLFVRNASDGPISADIAVHWKGPASTGTIPLSLSGLKPEETRIVDLTTLQQKGLLSDANWANVEIRYVGRPGDLVPIAASYDPRLASVFNLLFRRP